MTTVLHHSIFDMLEYKQFHCSKITPDEKNPGKFKKLPCDTNGVGATNEFYATGLMYFNEALAAAKKLGKNYTVAFRFTENDPFFFLDLDGCYNPDTKKFTPLAQECLNTFKGCAYEISHSGKGLHIFGTYKNIPPHSCQPDQERELYHKGKSATLTGLGAGGNSGFICDEILPAFIDKYFKVGRESKNYSERVGTEWLTDKPISPDYGIHDNEKLIARATTAKNKLGNAPSFKDLWTCQEDVLAAHYPPNQNNANDSFNRNFADKALAHHLAFWTGNNTQQMYDIMMMSALYRDKYNRDDYLPCTIRVVCDQQQNWYQKNKPKAKPESEYALITPGKTHGWFSPEQMRELFKDYVYVSSEDGILIEDGRCLGKSAFDKHERVSNSRFPLDEECKKWTESAWIAYGTSLAFKAKEASCLIFDPSIPFGKIKKLGKVYGVNKCIDQDIRIEKGDPSIFIDLVSKLFPDENDRKIIMCYMAALTQYPGKKFKWCPFIQSVEGTGKSMIATFLEYAIGRAYTHSLSLGSLEEDFNGYMENNILIIVNEFNISESKTKTLEKVKNMITEEYLSIRKMRQDAISIPICANFWTTGNDKGAVRKTNSERRFAIFYCPQQEKEDLKKSGMNPAYFKKIDDWAKADGCAIVTHYLLNYDLSDAPELYNPALGGCAPMTTSEQEAIEHSRSVAEQEIIEVKEEGVTRGFKGDFISAKALERVLKEKGRSNSLTPTKRTEILKRLGYVPHPCGRLTRLDTDGSKPLIYVKKDSAAYKIKSAREMTDAYFSAQISPDFIEDNVVGVKFG